MVEWNISFTGQGDGQELVTHRITALTISSRLNKGSLLELEMETPVADRSLFGTKMEFDTGSERRDDILAALVSISQPGEGRLCMARNDHYDADLSFGDSKWVLYQRLDDEAAWPFMRRVAAPEQLTDSLHIRDGMMERIEEICPAGLCLAVQNFLPPQARFTRMLNALAGRGGAVAGWVRTLVSDEYRLAGIYPDTPDQHHELASEYWSPPLLGLAGSDALRIQCSRRETFWKDPSEAIDKLLDPEIRNLWTDDDPVPVAPGTVKLHGRTWFATGVTTRVVFDSPYLDEKEDRQNVVTTLDLADVSAMSLGQYQPPQITMLIGCYDGYVEDGLNNLVCIVPPSDDIQVSPPLEPLLNWTLGESNDYVAGCQVASGFVRDDEQAFYARWERGDLVLFGVSTAGPAVVHGALRRTVPQLETEDAPAVTIMGKGIALAPGSSEDGVQVAGMLKVGDRA